MGFLKRLFGKEDSKKNSQKKNDAKKSKKVTSNEDGSNDYHVTLNKDEKSEFYKMWRVRMEHSNKTIKHFNTQKEAIDYARSLAEESESSVVVHKMDGTLRKH